jgi:hypothetical protein
MAALYSFVRFDSQRNFVLSPEFPPGGGGSRLLDPFLGRRVCPKLLLFYVSSENRMEERNVGPV